MVISLTQLPTHRKEAKGLIESVLTDNEYGGFERFESIDKILFASARFYDTYRRCPSGKELSIFVGLKQQTVSKYLTRTTLVASEEQHKGQDGRYKEKRFYLTEEGKRRYAELTYKLMNNEETR